MMLSSFLLVAALLFGIQLLLCFREIPLLWKAGPLIAAVLGDALCWAVCALGIFSDRFGVEFAAVIYGIVGIVLTAVLLAAWGVYAIIKGVQKRRK